MDGHPLHIYLKFRTRRPPESPGTAKLPWIDLDGGGLGSWFVFTTHSSSFQQKTMTLTFWPILSSLLSLDPPHSPDLYSSSSSNPSHTRDTSNTTTKTLSTIEQYLHPSFQQVSHETPAGAARYRPITVDQAGVETYGASGPSPASLLLYYYRRLLY